MIDVVTLNYNDAKTTIDFVKSIENYACVKNIVIVDNKSTDDSIELLKDIQNDKISVVENSRNGGYGSGNNLGIRWLSDNKKSKYILLSNPDVAVAENVLIQLESFLKDNTDYVIASPFMLDSKGFRQYNTAFRIPSLIEYVCSLEILMSKFTKTFYYKDILDESANLKTVGAVSGSLFMMNVDKMLKYGMYDENIFLYCEEIVLGLKFREAHQKIALLPQSSFIHNHSVSINKSFKSILARHRLLMDSKLYVIRKYFKANRLIYSFAWLISKISLFEVSLMSFIRRQ